MTFQRSDFVRAVKRMAEASGYLDLEMPEQALETLNCITNPGPFEAQIAFMRGQSFQLAERYEDAAVCLALAAKNVPPPFKKLAFEYLNTCLKESSDPIQMSLETLGIYRGAKPSIALRRFNI